MTDHRLRAAEGYLDLARARLAAANKVAIVWAGALVVAGAGILDKVPEIRAVEEARIDLRAAGRQLSRLPPARVTPTSGRASGDSRAAAKAGDTAESDSDLAHLQSRLEERAQEIATTLRDKEAEAREAREKARVAFDLPGMKLGVPTHVAPLIWTTLVAGLLGYLSASRRQILTYLARSARILVRELAVDETEVADWHAGMPWWLMPLPVRDGSEIGSASFARFAGTRSGRVGDTMPTALLLIGAIALSAAMGTLGWYAAEQLAGSSVAMLLQTLAFLPVALCLLLTVRWLTPSAVPDRFEWETADRPRRGWLAMSGSALALAMLVPNHRRLQRLLTAVAREKQPRYRRVASPLQTKLAGGLYRNPRSGKAHGVSASGALHVPPRTVLARFTPMTLQDVQRLAPSLPERAVLARASSMFEAAALDRARQNATDEACEMLLAGIRHDLFFSARARKRPSYRLYCLLARLSTRSARPRYFRSAMNLVLGDPAFRSDEELLGLFARWSSPRPGRPRARARPNVNSPWVGVPMEDG